MPKQRKVGENTPRKPRKAPSFDFENEDFLERVGALAYEGWYDAEIADELNVSRYEFSLAKSNSERLRNTIEEARARAHDDGADIPSPPKFAKLWKECGGSKTKLIKKLKISFTTLQSWIAQDPRLQDVMDAIDLEKCEQAEMAAWILALGGVKTKDKFEGWSRYPDSYMLRWLLNTKGRRFGYGENPVIAEDKSGDIPHDVDSGIDIEAWIKQEMNAKKNKEDDTE